MSRSNAVEIRDILLRLEEARHPLVSRAMLFGYKFRAFNLAVIPDLGGVRVTLNQKGFRPRATEAQRSAEGCDKKQRSLAGKGA